DAAEFFGTSAPRVATGSAVSPQVQAIQRVAASERSAVTNAARALRARRPPVRPAAAAFSVAPLVRLAILVILVWYAAGWLLRIAEVRALKEAFQRGEVSDDLVNAAGQAVRARIDAALGRTPAGNAAPSPAAPAVQTRTPPTPVERQAE